MVIPGVHQLGLDMAAIDGNSSIDWHAARVAGVRFSIFKRTQHVYPDRQYEKNSEDARAAGLVVGSYIFPGWGPRAASAKAQIATAKRSPGTVIPKRDLPPTIDVEQSGEWANTGWSKAQCVAFLEQLVREVEDQFGVTPMIYSSYNQWYNLGLPAAPFAARCPLWVKTAYRLRARQPVDQTAPRDPHFGFDKLHDPRNHQRCPDTWKDAGWWIQQFQGDATGFPGFNRTVDLDRFNVTRVGDHGPHVAYLQRKLVTLPLPECGPLNADGVFGENLEKAVRALQLRDGLIVDGIVGAQTFAAISWIN